MIRRFNDLGIAVVLATREPVVAAQAKRVYKLHEGRLIEIR